MKRFTDTDLWKKQWFMELTPAEKIAWYYIKDECDCVGVWSPNFRLAEFIIGMQLDWKKFMDKCNGNIVELPDGKWWLSSFVKFQYGTLSDKCKPHIKYISVLKDHGLYDFITKGYPKGIQREQEEEEETEQELEKEEDRGGDSNPASCGEPVYNFDAITKPTPLPPLTKNPIDTLIAYWNSKLPLPTYNRSSVTIGDSAGQLLAIIQAEGDNCELAIDNFAKKYNSWPQDERKYRPNNFLSFLTGKTFHSMLQSKKVVAPVKDESLSEIEEFIKLNGDYGG